MEGKNTLVDKKKLLREFSKRGLSLAGVSRDCGFFETFLSTQIWKANKNNTEQIEVPVSFVMLLHEFYNIRTESIIPDIEQKETHKEAKSQDEATTVKDMTPDLLYRVVYKATYDAMKLAMKGE